MSFFGNICKIIRVKEDFYNIKTKSIGDFEMKKLFVLIFLRILTASSFVVAMEIGYPEKNNEEIGKIREINFPSLQQLSIKKLAENIDFYEDSEKFFEFFKKTSVNFKPELIDCYRLRLFEIFHPVIMNMKKFKGHSDDFYRYAFALSKCEKFLFSGSADKTIRIWSLETGKCLAILRGHAHSITVLALSKCGNFLFSGSADKTIRIWKWRDEECLATLKDNRCICALVVSKCGNFLFSDTGNKISIWKWRDRVRLTKLKGHKDFILTFINALAISKCGNFLFSGSTDKTIKIWRWQDGKCLTTLKGHKGSVDALAISKCGNFLFSGSTDKTIKIWKWRDEECLTTCTRLNNAVNSLIISKCGNFLFSTYKRNNIIDIWNWRKGKFLREVTTIDKGRLNALAISEHSGNLLILISDVSSNDLIIESWELEWFKDLNLTFLQLVLLIKLRRLNYISSFDLSEEWRLTFEQIPDYVKKSGWLYPL